MKPALASAFAAGVVKIVAVVMEEGVGDDLFEGGVFFSRGPIHEEIVGRIEDDLKVAKNIGLNALKRTQFVEEFA